MSMEVPDDYTWSDIRRDRKWFLEQTDLWYLSDRWAQLTNEQQTSLNQFRQSWRDITVDFTTPLLAAAGCPDAEGWFF